MEQREALQELYKQREKGIQNHETIHGIPQRLLRTRNEVFHNIHMDIMKLIRHDKRDHGTQTPQKDTVK
jgi:hypothetical protein